MWANTWAVLWAPSPPLCSIVVKNKMNHRSNRFISGGGALDLSPGNPSRFNRSHFAECEPISSASSLMRSSQELYFCGETQ
jgi:hypothetical protein